MVVHQLNGVVQILVKIRSVHLNIFVFQWNVQMILIVSLILVPAINVQMKLQEFAERL